MDEVAERSGRIGSGLLAFLFTDIAGSTRLWEDRPKAMATALERHDAILRDAIERADGQVVKTTGDGLMAVFRSADRAVEAGIVAQTALGAQAWGETGPIRVRMGIHVGEADERDGDFFGPTINRTARIMAAGHGGQVLLSAAAAALSADRLPAGASLRDLGEYRLKDLGRPERVYQLVDPRLESSFPPLTTLDHAAGSLPVEATTFIGRRVERDEVARRLEDRSVRLLTLTGPGGTGKTSLAIRVAGGIAGRYRDGVSFVDLSAAEDSESMLIALGRALGIGEAPDRPLQQEVAGRLADRETLVVLDNFEQVLSAATVVADLIVACPDLTFVATSREPLHLRVEHIFPVPPLGLPPVARGPVDVGRIESYEAIQLFVDRARVVRPDFVLTDANAEAVADICRRLDGLPLAIELAAGRLRLFSPETLRDRLTSRLELLRSPARDLPARHQTLRATIEWSYQLLDAEEQRLFETFAAFADADLQGLESVATSTDDPANVDVVEALASLLEKNLVRQVEAPEGEPRFTTLETIREFATERLDGGDRGPTLRGAHAAYYTDLAVRLTGDLGGPNRDRALRELSAEVANFRIALRSWVAGVDVAQLTQLASALLQLNEARGWYHDTVELTSSLLAVLAEAPSSPELASHEIALRIGLARAILATEGYTPEAEQAYASALARFEGGGRELRQHYSVLRGLANLYLLRVEFAESRAIGDRILALAETEDDVAMRIDGHLVVGSTMTFTGEIRSGLEQLDSAIRLFEATPTGRIGAKIGNDPRIACLTTSGFALWLLGSQDAAVERANRAIELAHGLGHPYTSAYALFHSGLLHLWRREPDVVLDRSIRLLEIADAYDLRIWSALGACLLGAGQTRLGQVDQGLASIRDGMAAYQQMITPPVFWPLLLSLDAGASGAVGRPRQGLEPIERGIELLGRGSNAMLLAELELLHGDLLRQIESSGEPRPAGSATAGGVGPAVVVYRAALASARRIGIRMSELRALTRLVESTLGDERASFADDLRGSLAAFDEGFETADLREAQAALVEALSS